MLDLMKLLSANGNRGGGRGNRLPGAMAGNQGAGMGPAPMDIRPQWAKGNDGNVHPDGRPNMLPGGHQRMRPGLNHTPNNYLSGMDTPQGFGERPAAAGMKPSKSLDVNSMLGTIFGNQGGQNSGGELTMQPPQHGGGLTMQPPQHSPADRINQAHGAAQMPQQPPQMDINQLLYRLFGGMR